MRNAGQKVTYLVLLDLGAIEDHMARAVTAPERQPRIEAPGLAHAPAPAFAVSDGQGGIGR